MSVAEGKLILRSRAVFTMAAASGWLDCSSTAAAMRRTSSSGVPSKPMTCETAKSPVVSVPVLSSATVFRRPRLSK